MLMKETKGMMTYLCDDISPESDAAFLGTL